MGKRVRWGMLVAAGALVGLLWRRLNRYFQPANAELSVLQGRELVRRVRRVLAITAHPDDLELAAGGTLRLLKLAGCPIDIVVLSDGRQQNGRSSLGRIRQFEQEHAGTILGYGQVHRLGFRDLSLSRFDDIERRLSEVWSSVQPEVVFSFDSGYPEWYFVHPDHLTAGRVTLNVARSELGRGVDVYLYGTRDTGVVVDITPVIEDKVRAVLAHRSQLRTLPGLYSFGVRTYGRLRGRPVQMAYAEGFRALTMPPLTEASEYGRWRPVGAKTGGVRANGRARGRQH